MKFTQIKNLFYLTLISFFSFTSCNSEKLLFEKETWWQGHWQYSDDPTMFFSIGTNGANDVQFFISTEDSIYSNIHVGNLIDFNHRKKWKIMRTYDNQFIKIKEVGMGEVGFGNGELELYGPANTQGELVTIKAIHLKQFNGMLPLIPDSILNVR